MCSFQGTNSIEILLDFNGLKWAFPQQFTFVSCCIRLSKANGLKWTRTTDLTLIRRAL